MAPFPFTAPTLLLLYCVLLSFVNGIELELADIALTRSLAEQYCQLPNIETAQSPEFEFANDKCPHKVWYHYVCSI